MLTSKAQAKEFNPIMLVGLLVALMAFFVNVNCAFAAEWDKPGYELTFQDEFDGDSIDLTKWNNWDINFSEGPGIVVESNPFAVCPENVSVSDGSLKISCTYDPITAPVCGGGTKTVDYRVGAVNTKNKFQQTYGWFEARIKFPSARSLLPAYWLMPAPGHQMINQDGTGVGDGAEVDIVEYHTHWMGNDISSAIWWGGYGEYLQGGGLGTTYSPISDANDWHVYALNWEPGLLEIYVDGVKTQTYTGEGVPFGDEIVILSMACGTWGADVVNSELPDEMLVDYMRVYAKAEDPGEDPGEEPGEDPGEEPGEPEEPVTVQVINDNDPIIEYTGSWSTCSNGRAYMGDLQKSKVKNDSYTINFTGTQFKAYGIKDRWSGKVAVYVDNVFKEKIDCYNSTQLVDQLLFDTGVLANGEHTVQFVVLYEKNCASLGYYHYADKFEIINDNTVSEVAFNDDDAQVAYTGSWSTYSNSKAYNGDFHTSKIKYDYYTINFTGTQIKLYCLQDKWCGKVAVYVDNDYVATVDCYNPTQIGNQLFFDTGSLASGNHTVKVVVLNEKNASSMGYFHYFDEFRINN